MIKLVKKDTTIEKAQYICDTGKIIHDRIVKIQSAYFASSKNGALNDLSITQLNAIKTLWDSGELNMSELADQLAVSPPSASVLVDRLVEKGIFCREHSTTDRRKVVVRVSPEAEKIAEEITSLILQFFVDLVEKIGIENAQKWCDVLTCVKSALSKEHETQTSSTTAPPHTE